MKLCRVLVICCVLCTVKLGNAKKGFIFTSPEVVGSQRMEYFTLVVFGVPSGGEVTVRLLRNNDTDILAESRIYVVPDHTMWVAMFVPPITDVNRATLHIFGNFSDGYTIDDRKVVGIHVNHLTLIQTDKPFYKPGQTVRFRVLPMDGELKPLGKDATGDIWVEEPNGSIVSEWKDITFNTNMMQMEFPLFEEATLGNWSIKSLINNVTTVKSFKVEKYVLLNFEVKINAPSYLFDDESTLSVDICARYTYGKKVNGFLKAEIADQIGNTWIPQPLRYSGKISGCYTFVVFTEDLHFRSGKYIFQSRLAIRAEVFEDGTGIRVNNTVEIKVLTKKLHKKFLDVLSDEFKPGIPYRGMMLVQRSNGAAVASVEVTLCVTSVACSRSTECHKYYSDKNGIIRFTLNVTEDDILKIEVIGDTAIKILHPRYSPSGSYLQIEPVAEELECEKRQNVTIRYTAKKGDKIQFYYQILSRGRIVQQGSYQTFYSKANIPQSDTAYVRKLFSDDLDGNSLPNIGEFNISFTPGAVMFPTARLLVFYVRNDGEIVADLGIFRIKKCSKTKVKLSIPQKQLYPSTEAKIVLSANPSSICGIGFEDKSVQVLRDDTQFSETNLFKWMENLYRDHEFGIKAFPCFFSKSKDCLESHTEVVYYDYMSSGVAFEGAHTVVFTDLNLKPLPCIQSDNPDLLVSEGQYSHTYDQTDPRVRNGISFRDPFVRPHSAFASERFSTINESTNEIPKPQTYETPPTSMEEIRSDFPETWLWEMHTIESTGEITLKRQLPDTITEWVGKAVCVNSKSGLSISDSSSITAFQPFLVSLQMPDSATRGEMVSITASLFNYMPECLPIKIVLEESVDYELISEQQSSTMCVCEHKSEIQRFTLRPTSLGQVNIIVHGFSVEDESGICGSRATAKFNATDVVLKKLFVERENTSVERPGDITSTPQKEYLANEENECGGILGGTNGTITNPSFPEPYPRNKRCIWDIMAPIGFNVILNFTHFDLGVDNPNCTFGRVEIQSRTFLEGEWKEEGTYCESELPPVLKTEGNILRLEFISDRLSQNSGFSAVYLTDLDECASENGGCAHICENTIGSYHCTCHHGFLLDSNGRDCKEEPCEHVVSATEEVISSPNFPQNYPNGMKCTWKFETIPGHRIKLAFDFFEVETHRQCLFDSLRLYDGNSTHAPLLAMLCGSKIPQLVTSTTHTLLMVFESDSSVQKQGFRALHSTVCGGELTAADQPALLYSHVDYGNKMYDPGQNCTWIITAANSGKIRIAFHSFELETAINCDYDYVEIQDESKVFLVKFCSYEIPPEVISSGNHLFIHFHSDDSIETKGFALAYSEVTDFSCTPFIERANWNGELRNFVEHVRC